MSIKYKVILFITIFIVLLSSVTIALQLVQKNELQGITAATVDELNGNSEKNVIRNLEQLTFNISQYIVTLEKEMEKNMLNAALVLQQMDSKKRLTNDDLNEIAVKTGMNDLYLTDEEGVFISSTEESAIGISLFDIWDGYKMLITGEADKLPTSLTIKAETGEIYKFMAIPRADGEGIVESALSAGIIEEAIKEFVSENKTIKSIYMIDNSGTVLTETLGVGQESTWKKGKKIENQSIKQVFETSENIINIDDDVGEIYYPIKYNGETKYVLHALINTKPYYLNSSIAKSTLTSIIDKYSDNTKKMITNIIIIALVLIGIAIYFLNSFLKPLLDVVKSSKQIAAGNLSVEEIKVKSNDEIGELASSFNAMTKNLQNIISKVDNNSQQVVASAQQLNSVIDNTIKASEQITVSIQEIANGSDEQVSRVDESVNKMDTIENNVQKVLLNVKEASQDAKGTSQVAQDGNNKLSDTVNVISNIDKVVGQLSNSVNKLVDRSQQIGDIINVITEITEQTNLLSLNAAIEASRAGEHGRGFAVVAEEIRGLAERSSASTKQITDIISKIQMETSEVFKSMEVASGEVQNSLGNINESSEYFQEIKNSIDNLATKLSEIDNDTNQMSSSINNIVDHINSIASITQNNAAETESVASAAEEQLATMEETNQATKELFRMAEELKSSINKFEL